MRKNTEAVADRLGILPEYRSAFLGMSMDDENHTYTVPGVGEGLESVTTKIARVYNKDYKAGNIATTVQAYREGVEKYGPTTTSNGSEYFVVPVGDIDGIGEVATEAVQKNLEWYGTRGTAIHTAIEEHDTTGEYGPYVQAVDAWFDSHDHIGELWAHEVMVYHPTGKYAGTIDGLGVGPDGGLIIWDYKSGQKAPDHLIQLGGYASALAALTGKEVNRGYVCYLKDYLRIPKEGVYLGGAGTKERSTAVCQPCLVNGLGKNVEVWSWILGLDDWKRSKPWSE
jgi:hypothetical protein